MRRRFFGLSAVAMAFALDQVTKAIALSSALLASGGKVELAPFLDLLLVNNTGVSFGLLQDVPLWTLAALTGLIALWFAGWMWRAENGAAAVSLGLIVGGALSNIADRLGDGAVTDFIDVHWRSSHFPAFNLADVAITIGAAFLLWASLLGHRARQAESS